MARITIPKPKHVPHAPDKPTKTPMPDVKPPAGHGTWQECKVFDIEDTTLTALQSARCSVCGKYHTTPFQYYFDYYKYCPNCGTRLYREGEEDETD